MPLSSAGGAADAEFLALLPPHAWQDPVGVVGEGNPPTLMFLPRAPRALAKRVAAVVLAGAPDKPLVYASPVVDAAAIPWPFVEGGVLLVALDSEAATESSGASARVILQWGRVIAPKSAGP